jgi:glycosyltransferase involved in cell wall biosynthesis
VKLALVVPGGVDRSGERRVVPALLALIERLASRHELHVFALLQEPQPADWILLGAHIHNIGPGSTLRRAIAAIVAQHRAAPFAVVHSLWSGTAGLAAVLAARRLRRPSLVHLAGGELIALPDIAYGGRLGWRGRLREALVLRLATQLSAASRPMLQLLAGLGFQAERIPLGVDLRRWPPQKPRPRHAIPQLIHAASLNRIKDQKVLLEALSRLRARGLDFHLDIVGEDTLGGEVQALAASLGLATQVSFRGFLTQRELYPLMSSADLMLVSSLHEAGPLAVLEAAVVGVPTVGTAVGHIAEWAPAAASAVPCGDVAAFTEATAAVLADDARRIQLAVAAQKHALAEDADYTCERFEALHARLAQRARR